MENTVSTASKTSIANDGGSVSFKCPQCCETTIVRTEHERRIVAKYKCHACGFEGPN
ncbi:MAG: zinc finger domain-containing protein [Candidatus Nanoarchaeia archaeon]